MDDNIARLLELQRRAFGPAATKSSVDSGRDDIDSIDDPNSYDASLAAFARVICGYNGNSSGGHQASGG